METNEDLLTPEQTATLLGVAAKTLKTWRKKNLGPAFLRLGHHTVRYRWSAVQDWLKAKECGSSPTPTASATSLKIPLPDSE